MRAFVTGATGMVGSQLVHQLLARGDDVVALLRDHDPQSELFRSGDIDRVSVVSGALEDLVAVERAVVQHAPDVVFHLGAQTQVGAAVRQPLDNFEANVRGTWNLLEACRRQRDLLKAVVVASTDKAYGDHGGVPYTEDMPLAGTFPYDASKVAAEIVVKSYRATFGLPLVTARCGNIFGPGDLNWARLIPGTIKDALAGRRPVVRSDGSLVRDYFFVDDAAAAYLALADAVTGGRAGVVGEAFNFSADEPLSVLEVIGRVGRALGRELVPEVRDEAKNEIPAQRLSSDKAHRVLGWHSQYTFDAALAKTIAWYRLLLGASA
jgi:CDP-glucose 4,6-dehydratase